MNEHANKLGSLYKKPLRIVKQSLEGRGGRIRFEQTLLGDLDCVAECGREEFRYRDSARSLIRNADPGNHVESFGWRSTVGARGHDHPAAQGLLVAGLKVVSRSVEVAPHKVMSLVFR